MCNKSGFTLLEILVAVAIFALLATFVVPRLFVSKPKEVREKFIGQLNSLMNFAWQNAMFSGKVHEVAFSFKKKQVFLKRAGEKDKYGKVKYMPVKRMNIKTEIKIPSQFEFRNFYINSKGTNMIDAMPTAGKEGEVFFFVIPDGLSQEVVINFFDAKDKIARRKRAFSLVLNPFSAQFEVYDEFKKP